MWAERRLNTCLVDTSLIYDMLPDIRSHEDLDVLQNRVNKVREDLSKITQRAPALEILRGQVHNKLRVLHAQILTLRGSLGERTDPIPCPIGECLPSIRF
jgi:hypothetical protein